jgi:hypothetical protein
MTRGDEYYVAVCNKTGSISIYNESKNLFLSPYADGPVEFFTNADGSQNIKNLSRFGRSFSIIRVPYSLKLLIQELQVMNVKMHIITEDNVDQLLSMSYSDNIHKLTKSNEPTEILLKNLSNDLKRDLKQNREKVINYDAREEYNPSMEFVEQEEVFNQGSPQYAPESPQYAPESPQYAPGSLAYSPQYNPESPQYAQETPPSFLESVTQTSGLSNENPPTIPYTPIVQEFGKSENTLVETPTEQTILEVEEPQKNESSEATKTELEDSNNSTENNESESSSETKKIITL